MTTPPVPPAAASPTLWSRWKIELKVIAATAATFAVSIAVALLNAVEAQHELLGSLPGALQFVTLAVIPTVVTFLSGYLARHTPRGPADG
jgi:hypothetical protein